MKKINKIKAKKLFEQGYLIRVIPNKLSPKNKYKLYMDIKYLDSNRVQNMDNTYYCNDFDFVISSYKDNMLCFENGYYLNYYILDNEAL